MHSLTSAEKLQTLAAQTNAASAFKADAASHFLPFELPIVSRYSTPICVLKARSISE